MTSRFDQLRNADVWPDPAGLQHENPAVREGCCRLLDHLVDTDSMSQQITGSR
jgi:hypothetical protein